MKVLIVTSCGRSSRTGVQTYYETLARNLVETGWSVEVKTLWDLSPRMTVLSKGMRALIRLLPKGMAILCEQGLNYVQMYFVCSGAASKPDLIHAQDIITGSAAKSAFRGKIPVILTCHNPIGPIESIAKPIGLEYFWKRMLTCWFLHHLPKIDKQIGVSQYAAENFKLFAKDAADICVIHNGVPFTRHDLIEKKPNTGKRIVVNIGYIGWPKNQQYLVEVARFLAKDNVEFWFIGDGVGRKDLEEKIAAYGLNDQVKVLGWQEDVTSFVKRADLCVHVSVAESFGLAVVESIANGCPALAFAVGGIPEIFPEESRGALLDPSGTPELAANRIRTLLSNDAELKRLRTEQFEFARDRFSEQLMCFKTVAVYDQVLSRRHEPISCEDALVSDDLIDAGRIHKDARSGWGWSAVDQFGQRGLLLIVGMIQARLMAPAEFGLIASVSIFIVTAQCLIDCGLAQRILQKKEVEEKDYAALFWSNLCAAVLMSSILFLLSGKISEYLYQPELKQIIRVFSVVVLLMNSGRVQNATLARALNFKAISIINICANSIGCCVGVTLAVLHFGVWALVFQQVVSTFARAIIYWIFFPWRPRGRLEWNTVKELYVFGTPLLGAHLIQSVSGQVGNLLIARKFNALALGFYDRGRVIPNSIGLSLGVIFGQVNFPILSKLQHDDVGYIKSYRHFLKMAVYFCFPVLGALAIMSDEVLVVLMGEKWLPAVPYLQICCLISSLYIVQMVNLDVLRSKGLSGYYFKFCSLSACIQMVCIFAGLRWGIIAMMWGDAIGRTIGLIILMIGIHYKTCIKFGWQLRRLVPPILLTALLCLLLQVIKNDVHGFWTRFWMSGFCAGIFLLMGLQAVGRGDVSGK